MGLAVLTGILLVISFPHMGHPMFAWVALVPLSVATMRARSAREAFRGGLAAGAVHFAGTIYWIPAVMVEFGGLMPAIAWVVHAALVGYLALFPAAFAWSLWLIRRRLGHRSLLWVPVLWVASEVGRIYLFTGFPWELLGYSQTEMLPVAQLASVTGVLGLSVLVAGVNGAAAFGVCDTGARRWMPLGLALGAVAVVAGWGSIRLDAGRLLESGAPVRVAAAQGNVAQDEKWDARLSDRHVQKYLNLTRRAAEDGAELVVWPEAATPFAFESDRRGEEIRAAAREHDVYLLFGTTEVTWSTEQGARPRYYNAAALVDPLGDTVGSYRKQHLVPWGEYVPLRDLLFFVSPLVENVGGFSAGERPVSLPILGGTVGAAICYEIIYPRLVRGLVMEGSRLLTTLTNDAWYGRSSAPHQHFQMARLRAIEEGRYLVRAANTGISGVIDPYGRVLTRSGLFEDALLVADVRFLDELTVYARMGDVTAIVCVVLALLLVSMCFRAPVTRSRTL